MEKELFYRPFQLSCHVLKDLPGYFTFIRFAAFRDVELRYFDQVDDVEHTNARYHSLSYGNNVYLANGMFFKLTVALHILHLQCSLKPLVRIVWGIHRMFARITIPQSAGQTISTPNVDPFLGGYVLLLTVFYSQRTNNLLGHSWQM